MRKAVIKLGGSVIAPDKVQINLLNKFAEILLKISRKTKIVVVVGGGKIARRYINAGRALNSHDAYNDTIAIQITRANARLLISALKGSACLEPPETISQVDIALGLSDIVVMGGTEPGHTTDAVAALVAEYITADKLIICKNVDGVYTDDPNKNPKAKKLSKITGKELVDIVKRSDFVAGMSAVTDLVAANIIMRSNLKTYVINGKDPDNLFRLMDGEKWFGTEIN